MVEVLAHGDKNITECKFCGATLKYSVSDIEQEEKYLSQRDTTLVKYITCPDCGSKIYL